MIKGVSSEGKRSQSPKEDGLRAFLVQSVFYGHAVCNPFPAKAVTPLVKIASKHSLSGKICWPAVFVSKPLFHFGVHDKVGIEARGHITSYIHAGTTLRRTSSDVIMVVSGLTEHLWIPSPTGVHEVLQ